MTDESLSTQFGAIVGTLAYMSRSRPATPVSMWTRAPGSYSLGVILYELLTGLRPLDTRLLKQVAYTEMIRILKEERAVQASTRLSTDESLASVAALRRTEPRTLLALLRGELDWVVMKCLEKSRERRYETANGLAREVQRYLADEVVEARPPSATYRLGKFLKRHKGAVLAASLVLLALVCGMAGTTVDRPIRAEKGPRLAGVERGEGERQAKEEAQNQKARCGGRGEKLAGEAVGAGRSGEAESRGGARLLAGQVAGSGRRVWKQANSLQRMARLAAEATENPTIRELLDRTAEGAVRRTRSNPAFRSSRYCKRRS